MSTRDAATMIYREVDPEAITPTGGNVLVRKIEPERQTTSGIHLAAIDEDMKAHREAIVLRVSKEIVTEKGDRYPHTLQGGEKIMYQRRFGTDIGEDADGNTLMLLNEEHIDLIVG